MGDCAESVVPKFGLLAPAVDGGTISTRYFMPWTTHPTMAVTGSQCLSACALTPGTVAEGMVDNIPLQGPLTVQLEHPMGKMDVIVDYNRSDNEFKHISAGVIRTARKIAAGEIFV